MSGQDDSSDQRNRRRFLKGLGTLSVVGLAGCGGDDGGDTETTEPDTATPTETTEPDMGTPTETTEPGMGDTDTATETTEPGMDDTDTATDGMQPSVSSESVPMDDLGPSWRGELVSQTGGVSDQIAFELPEDGFPVKSPSGNTVDTWDGTDDKSADIYLGYDTDNFYMRIVVTDDTHFSVEGGGMWQGDSVQWASAYDNRSEYGPDYGFRHGEGGSEVVQNEAGTAQKGADAVDLQTSREGTTTTYEATVPWSAIYSEAPSPGDELPFDMIIMENDGDSTDGWEGALSWGDYGIFSPKEPEKLGTIWLDTDDGLLPFKAKMTGRATAPEGEMGTWEVTVANYADAENEITVSLDDSDFEDTVTVSAESAALISIEKEITGYESVGATLSNGDISVSL